GTSLPSRPAARGLDRAYNLEEYAGVRRRNRSAGKAPWPGRKQVWRRFASDGRIGGDILSVEDDDQPGEPLIQLVMQAGKPLEPRPTLDQIRSRAAREFERLPEPLRRLEPDASYPVEVSDALRRLAAEVHGRMAHAQEAKR